MLTRQDLWSLEEYAQQRQGFRKTVIAHKRLRQVALGDNVRLLFEDRLTIRYQIQEMLRIERIFEPAGIQEELDAYNPLIPDGTNWKATLMLEYPDVEQRREMVEQLLGIERAVWMAVDGHERVFAIADEDMDRQDGKKTSTVHFLRFELAPEMIASAKAGCAISAGVDHPALRVSLAPIDAEVRDSLAEDLKGEALVN